ncbi:MAG: ArsR/SmtB family transcription factor [Thermoplasmatota archaeon]
MEVPEPIRDEVEDKGGLEGIGSRMPSDSEIEELSKAYKALSDPSRTRILYLIKVQSLCVCCIKELVQMSDSKLSYHLSQLRDADMIKGEQVKNWIIYSITEKGRRFTFDMGEGQ